MSGTIFTTLKSKASRVQCSFCTHLFTGEVPEHSPGSWVTEREYVWSEGFSENLHLSQVIFKTWDEFGEVSIVQGLKTSGRPMCFPHVGGIMAANFIRGLLEVNICYKFQSVKGERSECNFSLMLTLWQELGWVPAHTFNQLTVLTLSNDLSFTP